MYGAIIGDLAGSIYEYSQLKSISNINADKIITEASFYSDDTILTVAILDAILNKGNYEEYLKKYIKKYANYKHDFTPYFKTPFSKGLIDWSNSSIVGTSTGNGAMMRISPVGYLFNTEESVIKNAQLATIPSHNSKEAVAAATIVALMIFYFRNGLSRDEVYQRLNIKIEYHPFKKFNTTCHETIGNCLYALYNSKSFEDAIRKTISMGGDTDTNACIVGSIAESMYPISPALISEAESKLPKEFVKILRM